MGGKGNTKPSRPIPGKRWCFTWNNYTKDGRKDLLLKLKNLQCLYIIGKEVGDSGTKHLQGYLECPKKIRPIETFKIKEISWRKCTKGTREDNIEYCNKDGNYVTNFEVIKDPLDGKKLYKWQKRLLKLFKEEPDDRTIHWYYGEGNDGKTAFAKHCAMKLGAAYVNGASKDIKYFLANMKDVPKIVIFGIPKSSEGYVSYSALEEVKDGIIFSCKYESQMKIYNPPHVVVFANFEPDLDMISPDRWRVKRLHS